MSDSAHFSEEELLKQNKSEKTGTCTSVTNSDYTQSLTKNVHAVALLYFFLWGRILKSSSAYSSTENTKLEWHVCTMNMEFNDLGNPCLEYENVAKLARF